MLEIDRDGFDEWDKRIIEALIHKFNGGPVGLNSLAVAVGEEAGTLEEVNEPYLIMEGYIKRTPQGRVAMPKAYCKLGLKPVRGAQSDLFGTLIVIREWSLRSDLRSRRQCIRRRE